MFQSRWERFTLIPINHFYSSPSTLVFCGCELKKADGWLSIFSWSLFKREDSCGLCHSGDFTTHTLSWLPSPSSSSLMKFATNLLQSSLLCIRGNPHVLDEELQRKFLIQLKDEQILYKWWFTHISLPSFVWSMYMRMLMSWESTCAERMCCANSIEYLWADSWHYSSSEALSKTTFPAQGSIL